MPMDLNSTHDRRRPLRCSKRTTTALALAESHYARIQKEDGQIGAFLTLSKERALEQADRIDRMAAEGKTLAAAWRVPVGIKDVMSTRGVRTTAGSKILENYIPPFDCTAVARMEAAGAVVLGKMNCDEFAMGSSNENSAYHPVRNPRDLEPSAWRIFRRFSCRGCGGYGGRYTGLRYWRFDSTASFVLRRCGTDADVRARFALRADCICIFARPHWAAVEDGEGCGHRAARDCRARSDGLDVS